MEINRVFYFLFWSKIPFSVFEVHIIRNSDSKRFGTVGGSVPILPGVVSHSTVFDEMINPVNLGVTFEVKKTGHTVR